MIHNDSILGGVLGVFSSSLFPSLLGERSIALFATLSCSAPLLLRVGYFRAQHSHHTLSVKHDAVIRMFYPGGGVDVERESVESVRRFGA